MKNYKQKRLKAGLYEYRNYTIEKKQIMLGQPETWAFTDESGTTYCAKTLKNCKEWIDSIES